MNRVETMRSNKKDLKGAFEYICKKYKVEEEDIRDCTERHIKARAAFIKLCYNKYGMALKAISKQVGGRTDACLTEYLEMPDDE